jgi:hypothetical protein|nr:MAG TPA: hypothetical protein [Bacteriophage sp.]
MALRTNTKKANANIRAYILGNFKPEGYTDNPPKDFPEVAGFILDTFRKEKKSDFLYYHGNEFAAFTDWCQGLPSVLDTCYYYNRSAVDDLGRILEETAEEKARFSEAEAVLRLTWLLYRELKKGESAAKKEDEDNE